MLPKKRRVSSKGFPRTKPLFRTTFPWGTVVFFRSPAFKAAVVVSKKIAKTAVQRNRLRRRIYAALAETMDGIQTTTVVYPNMTALAAPAAAIRKDLRRARALVKT